MAVAPKPARTPAPAPSPAEKKVDPPAPETVPEVVQLDFAANPNHYRAKVQGKPKKAKPRLDARKDRSPRLKLGVEVQSDENQEKDTEKE